MEEKVVLNFEDENLAVPDVLTGEIEESEEAQAIAEKVEELKEVLEEVQEDPQKPRKLKLNLDTVAVPEVELLLKHLK